MKNWKTSVIGIFGAVFYAIFPLFQGGSVNTKDIIIAAVVAGVSAAAKDSNVTGGTVEQ